MTELLFSLAVVMMVATVAGLVWLLRRSGHLGWPGILGAGCVALAIAAVTLAVIVQELCRRLRVDAGVRRAGARCTRCRTRPARLDDPALRDPSEMVGRSSAVQCSPDVGNERADGQGAARGAVRAGVGCRWVGALAAPCLTAASSRRRASRLIRCSGPTLRSPCVSPPTGAAWRDLAGCSAVPCASWRRRAAGASCRGHRPPPARHQPSRSWRRTATGGGPGTPR